MKNREEQIKKVKDALFGIILTLAKTDPRTISTALATELVDIGFGDKDRFEADAERINRAVDEGCPFPLSQLPIKPINYGEQS